MRDRLRTVKGAGSGWASLVLGLALYLGVAVLAGAATAADYYNAGLGLYQKGQFDQAHRYFAAAEQMDPQDWKAFQADGFCLYRMGQPSESKAACDKSLALHPDNPELKTFTQRLEGTKSPAASSSSTGSLYSPPTKPSGPTGRRSDLYLNPAGLLFGLGGVGFEHAIGNGKKSYTVQVSYASHSVTGQTITEFGLGGGLRFWLGDKPPLQGWFVGPEAGYLSIGWKYDVPGVFDYSTFSYTTTTESLTASFVYFGGVFGRQWVTHGGFLFNVGVSLDYLAGGFKAQTNQPTFKYSGISPGVMLNLGYAF